jgi:hypothetical protein
MRLIYRARLGVGVEMNCDKTELGSVSKFKFKNDRWGSLVFFSMFNTKNGKNLIYFRTFNEN